MIRINRYVLIDFDFVHILEYCQPVANAGNSHLFQFIMLQRYQGLAYYFIF
jgi:hypothetical protein